MKNWKKMLGAFLATVMLTTSVDVNTLAANLTSDNIVSSDVVTKTVIETEANSEEVNEDVCDTENASEIDSETEEVQSSASDGSEVTSDSGSESAENESSDDITESDEQPEYSEEDTDVEETATEELSEESSEEKASSEEVTYKVDKSQGQDIDFNGDTKHEAARSLINNLQAYASLDEVLLTSSFDKDKKFDASMPTTGNVKTLVFVVDFADKSFSDEWKNNVENYFFGAEDKTNEYYPYESLSAYYERSSYGKLHLDGEFFYYHDSNNRSVYDGNMDVLINTLIEEYCNSIMEKCDGTEEEKLDYLNDYLKQFDSNDDDIMDGIYVNFAGETTDWATQWWSKVGYYNAFKIGDYTFGSTCILDSVTYEAAITMIHETGHMLGLPDYYDEEVGNFAANTNMISTMDMMCDNRLDHNGFSKMLLGWIEPEKVTVIKGSGYENLQLDPYATSGELVLVVPDYDDATGLYTEFYMIEYYEALENDWQPRMEPFKGLRIYHVNAELDEYNRFVASNFGSLGDSCVRLIEAVHPDVAEMHYTNYSSMEWYAYYGSDPKMEKYECLFTEEDTLTPYTMPASCLYDTNRRFGAISYSGIVVDNISLQDNSVSFYAGFETKQTHPELTYEVIETAEGEYSSSFSEKLRFGTDIRLSNYSYKITAGELLDAAGNKQSSLNISFDREEYAEDYANITIALTDKSVALMPESYTIVIPAGTFKTSYGVENEEIRLSYDNGTGAVLQGDEDILKECESLMPLQIETLIDAEGNGYIAWFTSDFTEDKYDYTYHWGIVSDYKITSDTIMQGVDGEDGTNYRYDTIGLIRLTEDRFGWALYGWSYDDPNYYLLCVLDKSGKCISTRQIEDTYVSNVCGILDGQFLINKDYEDNIMYLYDFMDEDKDASFKVSYSNFTNTSDNGCKRLNNSSYAIFCGGGHSWVIYDETNTARIGTNIEGYEIVDVIYSEDRYYLLTRENTSNPEYAVLVYDAEYQFEKQYVLSAPADAICRLDTGFMTMCLSGLSRSSYGDVQCIYNDKFNLVAKIGTPINKWSANGELFYTFSVERQEQRNWRIISRKFDLSQLDFSGAEEPTQKPELEMPVSNIASGSVLELLDLGEVELTCETEGADIWYTVNGQIPNQYNGYSSHYTKPISLTKDMIDDESKITIKAYARKKGYQDSKVVTFVYDVITMFGGVCEGNHDITWQLDAKEGTLTISGSGEMEDFVQKYDQEQYQFIVNAPWYPYREYIQAIVVEKGITSIGNNAFAWTNLETCPTLPEGIEKIGDSAFEMCSNMKGNLVLPQELTSIGNNAFRNCYGIAKDLVIPEGVTSIGYCAFQNCQGLEGGSVELPESLSDISANIFDKWGYSEGRYVNLNVTIRCSEGSYADTWAKKYGFTVEYTGTRKPIYTVTFDSDGGSLVESQSVEKGSCAVKPTDPQREGYVFGGWYLNNTLFDFTTQITSNITLKAYWKESADEPESSENEESSAEPESSETEESSTEPESSGTEESSESPESESEPDLSDGIYIKKIASQTYSGSAIKPQVEVYYNKKLLQEKTDYTITYKNNINAGKATVTIKGKGNLTGSVTESFTIEPKDINDTDVIIEDRAFVYDGKAHKTAPAVEYKGKKLKLGKDFTVTYSEADYTEKGTYTVSVKGCGNYTGINHDAKITITDNGKNISKAKVSKIPTQEYNNGNAIVLPENLLTVTLNKVQLTAGKDYDVSYINNINPGKATVIIKGKGEYAGTKKVTFTIRRTPTQLTDSMVINKNVIGSVQIVKGGCRPEPVLKAGDYTLIRNTDYTVSYKNNKNVGNKASVVVKGKGNYRGSITIPFTITEKSIASSDISIRVPDVPYTGRANKYKSTPVITDADGTALKAGKDYTVVSYSIDGVALDKKSNPENGSVITLTISGKGNYAGTTSLQYRLNGTSITKARIKLSNKVYTGKNIEIGEADIVSATIKIGKQEQSLVLGKDFEIAAYSNNIKKGNATVIIKGIGAYAGEKKVTFKITAGAITK